MSGHIWPQAFLTLALIVGAMGLVAALLQTKKSARRKGPRPLLDYILLWPLLFGDASTEAEGDRGGWLRRNRSLIGWVMVALLVVLAMVFHW